MAYIFRTTGPWGPGTGVDLDPDQVDGNFWQAIQDIQAKAGQGVGISNIVVTGNQMTVVLTDHTLLGPYTLLMPQIVFRGEWQPNTDYLAGEIITMNGSTYMVETNHTSEATFDPGANDGLGNDFYGLLLESPASAIPTGGAAGSFLRKVTLTDFDDAWLPAALDDLSDVAVTAPASGQVLTYQSGHWANAVAAAVALNDLTDVTIATPTNGQVLTYVAADSAWENRVITLALSNLTDCLITAPAAGQPLVWNGTQWADTATVDIPCGGQINASGSITLDRSQGEVQRLVLVGTTTLTTIVGWPAGGQFARLVLEIQNNGGYGFAFPAGTLWPGGVAPTITPATGGVTGKDVFILISFDGGETVYGNVCGQGFA